MGILKSTLTNIIHIWGRKIEREFPTVGGRYGGLMDKCIWDILLTENMKAWEYIFGLIR